MANAYVIRGSQYLRYDVMRDVTYDGYPRPLSAGWDGLAEAGFDRDIDAAVDLGRGRVFLFQGPDFIRVDQAEHQTVGQRVSIASEWRSLADAGFSRDIDAAVNWGDGKAYFFKGDRYAEYVIGSDSVNGSPLPIAGNWPGLAEVGFNDDLDAAVNFANGKVYFFKGDKYVRYTQGIGADAGFPLRIGEEWPGFQSAGFTDAITAAWVRLTPQGTSVPLDGQYVVLRPDDMVVMGVRWSSFRREEGPSGPVLVAHGDEPLLHLYLPAQVTGEVKYNPIEGLVPPGFIRRAARSSEEVRLAFELPAGTRVGLTADDLLAAAGASRLVDARTEPDIGTTLDVPMGMSTTPVARDKPAHVVSRHAVRARKSRTRAVHLWRARLSASTAPVDAADSGLDLYPLHAFPDDPQGDTGPLSAVDREQLLANARRGGLPAAPRIELSALGGTFATYGVWPSFAFEYQTMLGREMRVRAAFTGTLYPFGHRASFVQIAERRAETVDDGDATDRAVAALILHNVLTVTEPVRTAHPEASEARRLPFGEVEILLRTADGLASPSGPVFVPQTAQGPLRFPVRCENRAGDVAFATPLVFVRDETASPESLAEQLWAPHAEVVLGGQRVDLVGDRVKPKPADFHELHLIRLVGRRTASGFRAAMQEVQAESTALKILVPGTQQRVRLQYRPDFFSRGTAEPLPLEVVPGTSGFAVDFAKQADRSGGLVAPSFATDAISREFGPVARAAVPESGLPDLSVFAKTRLLGYSLDSLVKSVTDAPAVPPQITEVIGPDGVSAGVEMKWTLRLKDSSDGVLRVDGSTMELTTSTAPPPPGSTVPSTRNTCTITDVEIALPPEAPLLHLTFSKVEFRQEGQRPPELVLDGPQVAFAGALQMLDELVQALAVLGDDKNRPVINATPQGITARYALTVPEVESPTFILRNIAVLVGLEVPFDSDRRPTVTLGFASREDPFNLSVSAFGGGGYVALQLTPGQPARLEVSLEFGAALAIGLGLASAEVHAFGGAYLVPQDPGLTIEGFLRVGGSVDILGLVSVSIELRVALRYDQLRNTLVGRASMVLEIDLTLFSHTVTLDTGPVALGDDLLPVELVLGARTADGGRDDDADLAAWRAYREVFAVDG